MHTQMYAIYKHTTVTEQESEIKRLGLKHGQERGGVRGGGGGWAASAI